MCGAARGAGAALMSSVGCLAVLEMDGSSADRWAWACAFVSGVGGTRWSVLLGKAGFEKRLHCLRTSAFPSQHSNLFLMGQLQGGGEGPCTCALRSHIFPFHLPNLFPAGSNCRTVEEAKAAGATRVLRVAPDARGRAAQMNAGAAVARGQLLAFLHADTLPPSDLVGWLLVGTP